LLALTVGSLSRRPQAPLAFDLVRRGAGQFVLPDAENQPGIGHQGLGVATIPSAIGGELRLPPVGVGFGGDSVLGAAVPEASIDKDRDAGPAENHIGPAGQAANVDPEAQTAAVQLAAQRDLRRGPGGTQGGHETTHRRARRGRPVRGHFATRRHG
jgi:hypothetical protein